MNDDLIALCIALTALLVFLTAGLIALERMICRIKKELDAHRSYLGVKLDGSIYPDLRDQYSWGIQSRINAIIEDPGKKETRDMVELLYKELNLRYIDNVPAGEYPRIEKLTKTRRKK